MKGGSRFGLVCFILPAGKRSVTDVLIKVKRSQKPLLVLMMGSLQLRLDISLQTCAIKGCDSVHTHDAKVTAHTVMRLNCYLL